MPPVQQTAGKFKIDVEGLELAVLRGGRACIARALPLVVLERNDGALERAGVSWPEVSAALQSWGYELGIWENGRWRAYHAEEAGRRELHNVIAANRRNPRHAEFIAATG